MEQKNYEYLRDSLARLGFMAVIDKQLETAMKLGNPQFDLPVRLEIDKGSMHFAFRFAQGEKRPGEESKEPFYFLNNVNTTLKREGLEDVNQNFLLFKQRGYDIREMKNLLVGRYVDSSFHKSGRPVDMWRGIDFTQKDEYGNHLMKAIYTNGEFDLKRQLNLPVFSGINESDKVMLIEALKKGDEAMVSVKKAGTREYVKIIAAPHIRQLLVLNEAGERINLSSNKLVAVESEIKPLPDATKEILKNQQQKEGKSQGQEQGKKIA